MTHQSLMSRQSANTAFDGYARSIPPLSDSVNNTPDAVSSRHDGPAALFRKKTNRNPVGVSLWHCQSFK